MTRRQWKIVSHIYTEAVALKSSKRRLYLDDACRDKDEIRRDVESLLAQRGRSGPFLGVYSTIRDKTVSHYQVLDQIGRGGMANVYKARDKHLGRTVAIKSLPPWAMGNPHSQKRLVEEARAASALNHPNIVIIYQIVRRQRDRFIVMEYIAGESLHELIPPRGLPVPRALDLALQISSALNAAHAAGILHGDLKPSNIMVTEHHRAKLLDFGIARRLGSSTPRHEFATKEYMAPEQHNGVFDPRSEIFSFGLILHEMLCGQHAFGPGTANEIRTAIRTKEPNPLWPEAPPGLAKIVKRCLEKTPERRFQSIHEVLEALEECSKNVVFRRNDSPVTKLNQPGTKKPHLPFSKLRSELRQVGYDSLAESNRAFAAIVGHLQGTGSEAVRKTVVAAMRSLILSAPATDGGIVASSARQVRKLALELIKLAMPGDLKACFEPGDLQHLDLYHMDLAGQQLAGMKFGCSFLVETDLRESNVAGASFAGAFIRNVNFTKADLTDADFTDADWFNALGLTQEQLAKVLQDTLLDCPATVAEMHVYLEKRYALPFESWSGPVREQLTTAWNGYLKPGGLRDFIAHHRRGSSC